jgi:hypothetical protein
MPLYDFQCEDGHKFEHTCPSDDSELAIACIEPGCTARASQKFNFGGLDHGIALFRDQAREGRFDENNLSTRYMSSGRQAWRPR